MTSTPSPQSPQSSARSSASLARIGMLYAISSRQSSLTVPQLPTVLSQTHSCSLISQSGCLPTILDVPAAVLFVTQRNQCPAPALNSPYQPAHPHSGTLHLVWVLGQRVISLGVGEAGESPRLRDSHTAPSPLLWGENGLSQALPSGQSCTPMTLYHPTGGI